MKFNEFKVEGILRDVTNDLKEVYFKSTNKQCDEYILVAKNKLSTLLELIEFE